MAPEFPRNARAIARALLLASLAQSEALAAPALLQEEQERLVPTLSFEGVQDVGEEGFAFVECVLSEAGVFAGGSVEFTVRMGFENDFFHRNLLQLFRRGLDVPVQLQADWLTVSRAELPLLDESERGWSLAVMDRIVLARRVPDENRGGTTFVVFEVAGASRLEEPGTVELGAPLMRFAYATSFRADLLADQVPTDHKDAFVRGSSRLLEVATVPEAGRPFDYTGIVGDAKLEAKVDRTSLSVGESVRLTVEVQAEGDLSGFVSPRIDLESGLRTIGQLVTPVTGGLRLTYDLVPESASVREVPPVGFVVFDPTPPGAYETLHTPPIPLSVRGGSEPNPDFATADFDGSDGAAAEEDAPPASSRLWGFLVLPVLAGGWVLLRRRSRVAVEVEDDGPRIEAAHEVFEEGSGDHLSDRLAVFLGQALGVPSAHLAGTEAKTRLLERGVPEELSERVGRTLDELLGARFGGLAKTTEEQGVRGLVEELARALRSTGGQELR